MSIGKSDNAFLAGIEACLEPAASKAVPDIDGKIRLSIALSLMRIANALEGSAANLSLAVVPGSPHHTTETP